MRLLTKIQVVLAAAFIISISLSSVFAVTRTISDTSDTVDTYIRNSNGKYWAATGANIQTAIWDLNSTGGTVWLPAKTLYVTAAVTAIRTISHLTLQGQGMGVTIIKAASGTPATILVGNPASAGAFNNITIRDMTLDGNSTVADSIYMVRTTDLTIENVYSLNPSGGSFIIGDIPTINKCNRVIIDGCKSFHTESISNQAISFTNNENSIINNFIATDSPTLGIDIHACRNSTFSNLLIYNMSMGMKVFSDSGECGGNNTFSNINIQKTTSTSTPAFRIVREHNSTFTNINIRHAGYTGFAMDSSSDLSLSNIYIDACGQIGMNIDNTLGTVSHININNGFIRHPTGAALRIDTANNITISNFEFQGATSDNEMTSLKDIKFIGCTFTKGTYGLIFYGTNSLFQIQNCEFLYNSIDGIDTTVGTSTNYTISNCQFISNAKGIDIAADSNLTIMNCLFRGNSGDGIECDALDSVIIMGCIMWGDSFDDNIVGNHNVTGTFLNIGMTTI